MSNKKIINEFERLIMYIKIEKEKYKQLKDIKNITANTFRLRQLDNILNILIKYPTKITLKNFNELKNIDGIGSHTINRIKEILETGKLSELKGFVELSKKEEIIAEFENIIGVGRNIAIDFYNKGITSIKMLKQKIKNKEIYANDKIKLGLKYHGKYKVGIPRAEITDLYKILTKIFKKINKKNNTQYIFEICGSYRREKKTSNDIDILISNLDDMINNEINHLHFFIDYLKQENILVDDITDKDYKTKYMGFSKLKDKPIRRIDIRYVPIKSYYSALLYFTGSPILNKKMRNIAKKKGLKLSEYGLFNKNKMINITSEKDIFDKLNISYIEPKYR
jgi:DNA polymerase/3'-5' exonuclease PolX